MEDVEGLVLVPVADVDGSAGTDHDGSLSNILEVLECIG